MRGVLLHWDFSPSYFFECDDGLVVISVCGHVMVMRKNQAERKGTLIMVAIIYTIIKCVTLVQHIKPHSNHFISK